MKKIILLSAIALCSTAAAQDFQQYISAKGTVGRMENKLTGTSQYYLPSSNKGPRPINNINVKDKDTVGGFRLAYGLAFPVASHQLRGEVEYGYNAKAKLNGAFNYNLATDTNKFPTQRIGIHSNIKTQTLMINAYFDFNTGTDFTPYVGAGLGMAQVKTSGSANFDTNNFSLSDKSDNFAWNVGVGVAYAINTNVAIDASYRYTDYGKVKATDASPLFTGINNTRTQSKVKSNEFNLGIRYTF